MSTIGFKANRKNSEAFKVIRDIEGATKRSIRATWFALGKDLKKEANTEILRKPKSGRLYIIRTKSGRRRRHIASAPGETHANLSGALRRSLSWVVHGADSMDFGYGFSTTEANVAPVYAGAIEFGRKDGSIKARPSILNAINKVNREAENEFFRAMTREFK